MRTGSLSWPAIAGFAALSLVLVLVNDFPLVPIGLLVALFAIDRRGPSFKRFGNLWHNRVGTAACLAASVAGWLFVNVGVNLVSRDGASSVGVVLRVNGGVDALRELARERALRAEVRAFLERPHWIAYAFDACARDAALVQVYPGCDPESDYVAARGAAVRVPRGTPIELRELQRETATADGKLVVDGKTWTTHLPLDLLADVPELEPSSAAAAEAIRAGRPVVGMTAGDVRLALGEPRETWRCRDGTEALHYPRGPGVVVDAAGRVTRVWPADEHAQAADAVSPLRTAHLATYTLDWCHEALSIDARWLGGDDVSDEDRPLQAYDALAAVARRYAGSMRTVELKVPGGVFAAPVEALRAPRASRADVRWVSSRR